MTDPQSVPPKEESSVVDADIVRWIPIVVPLGAVLIVFSIYVIWAAMLTQAV
jgi:hypothetical protein